MVGAGRPKTGARRINTSFCYPMEEVHTLEAIEQLARERGISFSNLIVDILKEEVERNRIIMQSEPNPLNIIWNQNVEQQQPLQEPTSKEKLERFKNEEEKILPEVADMNMDEFEEFKKDCINPIYMVRGPNKEKILEEIRQKHQKSNMDTVIPSSSQTREQEPEISIKEKAY